MSLKSDILTELEKNLNTDVSGQALADRFGVSRAAVSKAVASLRDDGCEIVSVTNRGYRLAGDALTEPGIRCRLPEKYRDIKISVLRETDSTNNEAKRLIAAGLSENAIITAEHQTAGRGRRGRTFLSPAGKGLYISLVITTDAPMSDAVSVTTMAAVATARAIERLTSRDIKIKWVNDLYLDGKKICGILTEAVSDFESGTTHDLVVGIGINVTPSEFPDGINASALSCEGLRRNTLAAAVASEVFDLASDLSDRSYMDYYRKHSLVLGREITFSRDDTLKYAKAVAIDDSGGLCVRLPDGTEETLRSGEITVRLA